MFRVFLFSLIVLAAPQAIALELAGLSPLGEGENRISLGGSVLFGVISPPASFSHAVGTNRALLIEERFSYTRGFGKVGLEDFYLEIESVTFQSFEETVNGTTVHDEDYGWALTLKLGGNFVHTRQLIVGMWLQGSVPLFIDTRKFVNPVLSYIGGGFNVLYSFIPEVAVSQMVYFGSGLFAPNRRNPHFRSATLGHFNFGKPLFNHDVLFTTGVVLEADLISRTDANYQASALGNGQIKNFVFITPFLLDISLGKGWNLSLGHAVKWLGKSARGSQFSRLSISATF